MNESPRCASCGSELSAGRSGGRVCLRCALDLALENEGSDPRSNDTTADPEFVGPYRIIETLGEGGMGIVYLAEQGAPVRRRVALKLIKLGMDTRDVIARFESERQALALMRHPHVAKVLDVGSTPQGRPYFAMEYVPGEPITDYCDRRELGTAERLELFVQVCHGVQHAHHKGIIHRDLKPTNVLVEEDDGRGVPKIIDFGVAKATNQRLTERTLFTRQGQIVGTPEYMSPEQAESNSADIDTRTDVYSLGVLLYELLVGALPLDPTELRRAAFEEICRRIREDEPVKPSTRINDAGEVSSRSAARRRTDPVSLSKRLRGDLDWITMKALAKERIERYASPDALATDILHHMRNEPIEAGPPGMAYRAGKFIRRHRLGVGLVAISTLLLIGFAATMTIQTARITHERNRANAEAQAHRTVADFLKELFTVSSPGERRGNSITAREILDRGVERMAFSLQDQPETRTELMTTMGEVYFRLGLYEPAEQLLVESGESQLELLGEKDPRTLRSRAALAEVRRRQGRHEEAEKMHRRNLELQREVLGPVHPDIVTLLNGLGLSLMEQGRFDETEDVMVEAIEVARSAYASDHPRFLGTLANLAVLRRYQGRYDEAEKLHREGLELALREWGPDHPETLALMHDLAYSVWRQSRFDEAERMYEELVPLRKRVLGEEHQDTIASMNNLAGVYMMKGRLVIAEELYQEVLELSSRVLGDDHPDTLRALNNIGMCLGRADRLDESAERLSQVLEGRREVLGPEHPETLSTMYNLAHTYYRQGRYTESEELHRRTLELRRKTLGQEHPATLASVAGVASALEGMGRWTEAEELLAGLLETRRRVLGESYYDTLWAMHDLATVRDKLGRRDEATALLEEAVQKARESLGEDHPDTVLFADTLLEWKQRARDPTPQD